MSDEIKHNPMNTPPELPTQAPVDQSPPDQATADMFAAPVQGLVPGGLWRRMVARFVDSLIVTIVGTPITLLLGLNQSFMNLSPGSNADPFANLGVLMATQGSSFAISTAIGLAYYCWFNAKKGGTPGRLVMGLKVVNAENGTHLSFGSTILRETLGMWLFNLGMVLFLLPIWLAVARKDRRTWPDLISGSQVLYDKNS